MERPLIICALMWIFSPVHVLADPQCSSVHTYLGNHPREKSPGWHERVQGLTEGQAPDGQWYWYISQKTRIWQIPIERKLSEKDECGKDGVVCKTLGDLMDVFPEIESARNGSRYDHFGDVDYYEHDGKGYVFIPLEGQGDGDAGKTGGLVALRAPSLEPVAFGYIPTKVDLGDVDDREHAPWVAFDRQGFVYVSEGKSPRKNEALDPKKLRKLELDWNQLNRTGICSAGFCVDPPDKACSTNSDCIGSLAFGASWDVVLEGPANGTACIRGSDSCPRVDGAPTHLPGEIVPYGLFVPQGADFSDDGRLLYIINGSGTEECMYSVLPDPDDESMWERHSGCGIHVFETRLDGSSEPCSSGPGSCEAVRIERSSNGSGPFNYQYNPGFFTGHEEPEGLTYWDLDDPSAPAIPGSTSSGNPVSGQLHAFLLQIEDTLKSDDDIYLKHYRANVTCEVVPPVEAPSIRLEPSTIDFDEVPVGGLASRSIRVVNEGGADLTVDSMALTADSGDPFALGSLPPFPMVLGPGDDFGSTVYYEPVQSGPALGTIEVISDDPDVPIAIANVGGEGVGFADQAKNLLSALLSGVDGGEIVGTGPGRSAPGRLGALIHMLEAAAKYVEKEDFDAACEQLLDAQRRADSERRPPDFVSGPRRAELESEIKGLHMRLGCP